MREQFAKAGRRLAEQAQPKVQEAATHARHELAARGPDVAEQVTVRAVDRLLWIVAARSGVLAAAVRPMARPVRNTAGSLARDLAKAAGGGDGATTTSAGQAEPPSLPEEAGGTEGRSEG